MLAQTNGLVFKIITTISQIMKGIGLQVGITVSMNMLI